ncbi:MAG: hypothetical protein KTR14_05020, partial [Vampirovibrio sp.]|nr:hypothetical protein [Vampirovibrio sp.]
MQFFWGAFLALTFCSPAWGTEPNRFELPLDCKINQTCWVVNYVDVDPAPGSVQDIGCGKRTY